MSLNNKFKERKPEETIKIIENFFNMRNYKLKYIEKISTIGTYSFSVSLIYNDIIVLHSNGKGATSLLAKASGLGELYERFCSRWYMRCHYNFKLKFFETSLNDRGYNIDKDEVIMNKKEYFKIKNVQDHILKPLFNNDIGLMEKYYTNVNTISLKFNSLYDNTNIYYPYELIHLNESTTGLAAGNTLEEALNQGLSEMAERISLRYMFDNIEEQYSILNIDNIQNNYLKDKLKYIEENIGKVFVYDLSYNTGLPVIGVLIVNQQTNQTYLDFGSFPIFDIALERCLTELFQNVINISDGFETQLQVPSRTLNLPLRTNTHLSKSPRSFLTFPYEIINTQKTEDTYSNVFVEKCENNIELLNYYKKLFKEKDYDVYYRDDSLTKDMYSVTIFIKNTTVQLSRYENLNTHFSYNDTNKFALDSWNKINDLYSSDYNANDFINTYLNTIEINSTIENRILTWLNYGLSPTAIANNYLGLEKARLDVVNQICSCDSNIAYTVYDVNDAKLIKKYLLINEYMSSKLYSIYEIKNILTLLGIEYTNEDFLRYNDRTYLLEQIYIKPYYALYNSNDYVDIIRTFYNDEDFIKYKKEQ